jgi:hypothetical protein
MALQDFENMFITKFGSSSLTEKGFCQEIGEITIVGSLEPIGSKTDTSKTSHGISNDTWVCHAYYTHEGKALAFPVPVFKTFSEMMAAVEVILTSL